MNNSESKDKIKYGVSKYNNIMGITCYMNSILAILQQCPEFTKYIVDYKFKDIIMKKTENKEELQSNYIIYQLYKLFKLSFGK
jgi:ubiquitin C-terminal hydrolase